MRDLTDANVTDSVLRQVAGTKDERQRQIVDSFVRHLHAFIRDVEPSEEEWLDAIAFLERAFRRNLIPACSKFGNLILMRCLKFDPFGVFQQYRLKAESRASPEIGRCRSSRRPNRRSVQRPLYIEQRKFGSRESAH